MTFKNSSVEHLMLFKIFFYQLTSFIDCALIIDNTAWSQLLKLFDGLILSDGPTENDFERLKFKSDLKSETFKRIQNNRFKYFFLMILCHYFVP
jgi:hypothetical protein